MSNIALFNGGAVPAFARTAELSAVAKSLAGGADSGKRISIKGGVFRLMDSGKQITTVDERYLDVVILNAAPKVNRVWYAKKFDGDSTSPPDCYSVDGDTPADNASKKQSDTCASCPQNIAGSGEGESRACRFQQRIAVAVANDIEGAVMEMTIPAKSLFGKEEAGNMPLQAYARWLGAQKVSPEMVVTRLKFDTDSESPKLFFKAMRWLSDEEYAIAKEQAESPDALRAITFTVSAVASSTPALAGKPPARVAAPAPAPAAAPEPEADEPPPPPPRPRTTRKAAAPAPAAEPEAPAPEPAVRKAAEKTTSVPAKASLAEAMAGWDDE